jgi:hypothetical protein
MYEVIGEFPFDAGAVNETVALVPFTAVATPIIGAPGALNVGGVMYTFALPAPLPPRLVAVATHTRYLPLTLSITL